MMEWILTLALLDSALLLAWYIDSYYRHADEESNIFCAGLRLREHARRIKFRRYREQNEEAFQSMALAQQDWLGATNFGFQHNSIPNQLGPNVRQYPSAFGRTLHGD